MHFYYAFSSAAQQEEKKQTGILFIQGTDASSTDLAYFFPPAECACTRKTKSKTKKTKPPLILLGNFESIGSVQNFLEMVPELTDVKVLIFAPGQLPFL
jgi:hypothetical protein